GPATRDFGSTDGLADLGVTVAVNHEVGLAVGLDQREAAALRQPGAREHRQPWRERELRGRLALLPQPETEAACGAEAENPPGAERGVEAVYRGGAGERQHQHRENDQL